MQTLKRWLPFLAFTAVFAVLAGFVFWGTWSMDVAPVMPDHPTTHAADSLARFLNGWLANGKFVPGDVIAFLGSPYFWQELKYVLSLYCAALGLAYFCRGRGLPSVASYGAGLLLAFSGYWMTLFSAGHYGWFQWMTYGVFAFGLVDRAVAGNRLRHWLLLGAVVAWASFYQQDLWLFFTVFTAAYFVFRCISERAFPWKGVLVSALAFALIGLPSFRDAFANSLKGREEQLNQGQTLSKKDASEADKRWEFVTNWSMPPEDTAEFLIPGVHGDTSCPFVLSIGRRLASGVTPYEGRLGRPMNAPSGNYRQHSLYLGAIFCLFALLGVSSSIRGLFNPSIPQSLNLSISQSLNPSIPQSNNRTIEQSLNPSIPQSNNRTIEQSLNPSIPQSNNRTIEQSNNLTILFFSVAALVFYLLSLGRFFEPAYRLVFALPFGDMIRCPVKWHHLTEFCLAVLAGFGIAWALSLVERLGSVGRYAPWIVGGLVFLGAFDLARVDRRYCAPVDVSEARRTNSGANLTFLPRQQFQNPQVAEMVRQRKIVSVANYVGNPDVFLVSVVQPFGPDKPPARSTAAILLGLLSLAASLGVIGFAVRSGMTEN